MAICLPTDRVNAPFYGRRASLGAVRPMIDSRPPLLGGVDRGAEPELVAAREAGSAPLALEGGSRLDGDAAGATYKFELLFDSASPKGSLSSLLSDPDGGRRRCSNAKA